MKFFKNNKKTNYKVHKLLANAYLNADNKLIDHINRNKLDNSLENLRVYNQSQNLHNVERKPKSGLSVGVYKVKDKYKAVIMFNYKSYTKIFDDYWKAVFWRCIKRIEYNK